MSRLHPALASHPIAAPRPIAAPAPDRRRRAQPFGEHIVDTLADARGRATS